MCSDSLFSYGSSLHEDFYELSGAAALLACWLVVVKAKAAGFLTFEEKGEYIPSSY